MIDNNEGLLKHPCSVCFESLESNEANINDKGMSIAQCPICEIQCHYRCIGIENVYPESNQFTCDPCSNKTKNYHCDICLSSQGYMKQYKPKKYVHAYCALFSDLFSIRDFTSMKFIPVANIDKVLKASTGKKASMCALCNKAGGSMIKCSHDSCVKQIHLYCGMYNQYNTKISNPESNEHWVIKVSPNVNNVNLITEDILKKEDEIKAIETRSGSILVNCPEHIGPIEYCRCKSSNVDDNMICCDYCDTWFHMKCLNIADSNLSKYNNTFWYCQPCTLWLTYKENTLKEVNAQSLSTQLNNKIVHQLLVYKINDLIYMGCQFIQRANRVINNKCSISTFIEVLLTRNSIPFVFELNSIVNPLNVKLSNYKSINHSKYPDDVIQELNYYLSSDINEDISSNHLAYFNKLLNDINNRNKLLEEEYISIGFISQENPAQINTINKITWCINAITILIDANSTNPSVAKCKIDTIKDLHGKCNFTDPFIVNLNNNLTQLSTQYYNWINEFKALLSTYTENKNQLDKYDKEINQQMKREKNPITKLGIKKDKILSHLSIKIPKAKIDQLLLSGKQLAIDASNELLTLENDYLKPLNELIERINGRNISYDEAKDIFDKMTNVNGIIVSDDILKEFNEDYFNAKKWEYNSIDILNEKKIDFLQKQIDAYSNIKFISDDTQTNLLNELCDLRDKMINLKDLCSKALASTNDVMELENIKDSLKKNNINDEMLNQIEEKIDYINHINNIFKIKNYTKKDIEVLRDNLIKYGLSNDGLENEIKERIALIVSFDTQIKEQLLSPVNSINPIHQEGIDNNDGIQFGLKEMKTIFDQAKQYNIMIDYSDALDTCISLWKLNEEFEANSSISKLNASEEHLHNLIAKHSDIIDLSIDSRLISKIKEIKHKILLSKGNIILSSKNSMTDNNESKLCLDDLKIFFEDMNGLNDNFNTIYTQLSEEQRNELQSVLLSVKKWFDDYNILSNEVYSNYIDNGDKCKEILSHLKSATSLVIEYIDISSQLSHFEDIEQLLILNDEILNYINAHRNNNESQLQLQSSHETKPSITQLKASYEEYCQRIKGNTILKSLSLLKEEIIKIDLWLERYSEYQNKKRKRFFEQIDLDILQTMLNESKSFICNVDIEQSAISSDLNSTKNFYIVSKNLLADSDPFCYNNIIQLSPNNIDQLNQIISDLNSHKVLISDKAIIDNIKTLDWCTKIKSAMSSQVEYHTINKIYQEGLALKRYNELQKQDYIQEILNQITLAKNYKELADLITKTKQKQISQDEFDSIVSEYNLKCHIVFIEEKETIETVNHMRREFESIYDNYYKTKANLQDYEKLFNDIIKFPIRLDDLISKIHDVIVVTKLLQKEVKKVYEQRIKNNLILTQDKINSLVEKCKNNNASFPEGEQLMKAYATCLSNLTKLKQMIKEPNSDLYEMIGLKEDITIHCNNDDENEINKVIWKRKYDELIVNSKPTQLVIEHLLSEIREISIELDDNENELLTSLRDLHAQGDMFIEKIGQCCSINELNTLKIDIYANCRVDLSQHIVEHETKLNLKLFPTKAFLNQKKKKEMISNKEGQESINEDSINQKESRDNNMLQQPEKIKLVHKESNTIANTVGLRSKRNVKRKINNDYYYEKEFVDNFENKIAVRNQIEDQIELDKAKGSVISETESHNTSNQVLNDKDSMEVKENRDKEKEKEKHNFEQKDINERIENILLNKKTKRPSTTSNQGSTSATVIPDQLKQCIQKNTVLQFENLFKENPIFNKEGIGFISTLSKKLEEELSNAYPKIDSEYQKVLSNMLKTVKKLENFKKVSALVVKGKVTLFKVAKFPYGLKYIQKLQGIEDSVKQKQRQKEEETIQTLFTGVTELYSSLSVPTKPKEEENKERLVSINASLAQDDEDDDNGSLKSLSEKENIRFSPGGGAINKNKALTTSTTIQSALSPQKQSMNDKNEKIYDPFNNEDMFDSFAHKKKKFIFAIFYDPERKKLIKEIVHPDIAKKVPDNSILKIWNGKLIINKFELPNVSFLSTNQYDFFEQFPQFASEIIISNRAKTNEVIPYVEKQLNNKQKLALYGWLEIDSNSSNEKYISLAEEYDKHDRCACLIIHNIKLYIFSLSAKYQKFNSKFRSECYFYNDVVMSQMDKLLVFVLIANKSDLIDIGKRISPIVLKRKEITMSQENDNMSPITSEDENDKEEQQKEEYDEKLEQLLETNDLKLLEEYVNTHFSDLSNTDIAEKLMAFDEERRTKLLMLITQYQMNSSSTVQNETNFNEKNIQYINPDQQMEIDDNLNNETSNNQDTNAQLIQKRFEEVINEEQMRRMNQLSQMQMQQNNTPMIPPYYNPSMMSSNPSMYPMMNEYNQMMMHQQQHQNQSQNQHQNQLPHQHQLPRHQLNYQNQPQPKMHQRYSNNQQLNK